MPLVGNDESTAPPAFGYIRNVPLRWTWLQTNLLTLATLLITSQAPMASAHGVFGGLGSLGAIAAVAKAATLNENDVIDGSRQMMVHRDASHNWPRRATNTPSAWWP